MSSEQTIVILDGYTVNPGDNPWLPIEQQGNCIVYERTSAEQVVERAEAADILLLSKVRLDENVLSCLPRLKYISLLATGYNNVDVAAAGRRGIPVSNIPAYSTASVAQATMALVLELALHVGGHDRSVKAGEWCSCPDFAYWKTPLRELAGLTMGIVGYGAIGRAVAAMAAAFGMNIIVYTPRIPASGTDLPVKFVSREELFATADVVSLHCPQTPENTEFVNSSLLKTMKSGAYLLNLARGGLINETDLAAALRDGIIAGAGVDVVSCEPMRPDNPLLTAPNCIITPHLAWASLAARQRLMNILSANVAAFLAGAPINVVNQQFLG